MLPVLAVGDNRGVYRFPSPIGVEDDVPARE